MQITQYAKLHGLSMEVKLRKNGEVFSTEHRLQSQCHCASSGFTSSAFKSPARILNKQLLTTCWSVDINLKTPSSESKVNKK